MQSDDFKWMSLALEVAREGSEAGEVPVGAIAVFENRIIASAHNLKERDQDPTAHAEMTVIREAATALQNWRLEGVTIYCSLEPCPMCAGAMIQARLGRLVYGAPDVRFGAAGTVVSLFDNPEFNHAVPVTGGVLAEESASLLRDFFGRIRRRS